MSFLGLGDDLEDKKRFDLPPAEQAKMIRAQNVGEMAAMVGPAALARALKGAAKIPRQVNLPEPMSILPDMRKFKDWFKDWSTLQRMVTDRTQAGRASEALRGLDAAAEQQQILPGLRKEFTDAGKTAPDDNVLLWLNAEMKAPPSQRADRPPDRGASRIDTKRSAADQIRDDEQFSDLDFGPTREPAQEQPRPRIHYPKDPDAAETELQRRVVDSPFYGSPGKRQSDYPWKNDRSLWGPQMHLDSEGHIPIDSAYRQSPLFDYSNSDAHPGFSDWQIFQERASSHEAQLEHERRMLAEKTTLKPGSEHYRFNPPEKGFRPILTAVVKEHELDPSQQSMLQRAYKDARFQENTDPVWTAATSSSFSRKADHIRTRAEVDADVAAVRPALESLLNRSALLKALQKTK
jgi:hypothetical protein